MSKKIKPLLKHIGLSPEEIECLPINYLDMKIDHKRKLVFMTIERSEFHNTKFFPKKEFNKPISRLF